MKRPRFTDEHKYPVPYRSAAATNIRATFRRIQAEQKKNEAERGQKVQLMRKVK